MAEKKLRVLVVGLGNMGMSHALTYTRIPDFEVVGVCERRIATRELPDVLKNARVDVGEGDEIGRRAGLRFRANR